MAMRKTRDEDPRLYGREIGENRLPVMRQIRIPPVLTPREKVLKALRLFRMVFEYLEKDKAAAGSSTKKTYLDARDILVRSGKHVNGEKRVGVVPGVEVGDEFDYKAELNIIGLHFSMSRGIDFMTKQGLHVATSVVVSQGAAYSDTLVHDGLIYCGEGDYLKRRDQKAVQDQRMIKGNLSLANSISEKNPVRVITVMKRGQRKVYVYAGLYCVEDYWEDQGPLGNLVFKFKLQRLPGQAAINLNH